MSNKVEIREVNNVLTTVFVVDMVNGFTKEGVLASPNNRALIAPIQEFLSKVDRSRIVFINDMHDADSLEFISYPAHCHTEEEASIVSELVPYAKEVVSKNSTNAFFKLVEYNIKQNLTILKDNASFVIVGNCTDICIMQLALTLKTYFVELDINKNVYVIENLCNTFDAPGHNAKEFHDMAIRIMAQNGIKIVTV